MTKGLVLLTLEQEVLGSNFAGGGFQLMTVRHFIAQSFIITLPLTQYD